MLDNLVHALKLLIDVSSAVVIGLADGWFLHIAAYYRQGRFQAVGQVCHGIGGNAPAVAVQSLIPGSGCLLPGIFPVGSVLPTVVCALVRWPVNPLLLA